MCASHSIAEHPLEKTYDCVLATLNRQTLNFMSVNYIDVDWGRGKQLISLVDLLPSNDALSISLARGTVVHADQSFPGRHSGKPAGRLVREWSAWCSLCICIYRHRRFARKHAVVFFEIN